MVNIFWFIETIGVGNWEQMRNLLELRSKIKEDVVSVCVLP